MCHRLFHLVVKWSYKCLTDTYKLTDGELDQQVFTGDMETHKIFMLQQPFFKVTTFYFIIILALLLILCDRDRVCLGLIEM